MAQPVGAKMKSREPSRTVDCGNDCPVVADNQDGMTGPADERRGNTLSLQLRKTRSRNRNCRRAGTGVAVPIEMRQHKSDQLSSDSALIAAHYGVIGHASELVLAIEVVHLSAPYCPSQIDDECPSRIPKYGNLA
jgi:hypothetical protein